MSGVPGMRLPNSQFAASPIEQRLAQLRAAAGDALADLRPQQLERQRRDLGGELAAERDRDEVVPVDDEHAAVVVIDQRAELGGDLVADLAHVVQPVQLPAQALQHLQVRDRAHVACGHRRVGALGPVLLVEDDAVLAVRLRGHHRGLGARAELARVHGVLRAEGEPDRDGDATDRRELELAEPLDETLGDARRVGGVARAHDHAELLAAEPADDVLGPNRGAQRVREQPQQLVADAVAVHVVDALEVVDVEHQHRHRTVRPARLLERVQQPLVEGAVVEQPGERVGARLVLEPRADLRVVERERGGVAEALRQLELVVAERRRRRRRGRCSARP